MKYTTDSPKITCTEHSTEEPTVALMFYDHKTAGSVCIARGRENIRRAVRQYKRLK